LQDHPGAMDYSLRGLAAFTMSIIDHYYDYRRHREDHYDDLETVHVINLKPVILVGGIPAYESTCWWKFWLTVSVHTTNQRKETRHA